MKEKIPNKSNNCYPKLIEIHFTFELDVRIVIPFGWESILAQFLVTCQEKKMQNC